MVPNTDPAGKDPTTDEVEVIDTRDKDGDVTGRQVVGPNSRKLLAAIKDGEDWDTPQDDIDRGGRYDPRPGT